MRRSKEKENEANARRGVTTPSWRLWCRLCAKEKAGNDLINEAKLARTIERFFWIDMTNGDDLPKSVCTDCYEQIKNLTKLSDKISKIQKMFCRLQTMVDDGNEDYQSVRQKFGLLSEERPKYQKEQQMVSTMRENSKTRQERKDKKKADLLAIQSILKTKHKQEKPTETKQIEAYLKNDERDNDKAVDTKLYSRSKSMQADKRKHTPMAKEKSKSQHRHVPSEQESLILYCNQNFNQDALTKLYHKYVNGDKRPYRCDKCGEGWTTNAELRVHMCAHKDVPYDSKQYVCIECGLLSESKRSLRQHLLMHSMTAQNEKCKTHEKKSRHEELKAIKAALIHNVQKPAVFNAVTKVANDPQPVVPKQSVRYTNNTTPEPKPNYDLSKTRTSNFKKGVNAVGSVLNTSKPTDKPVYKR